MSAREQGRYVLLFLMGVIFLVMVGICIAKWSEQKVGETQSTRSASKMVYPSITLIPWYENNASLVKMAAYNGSKNLGSNSTNFFVPESVPEPVLRHA